MAVAGASYGQYMGSCVMDLAAFMEERMSLVGREGWGETSSAQQGWVSH